MSKSRRKFRLKNLRESLAETGGAAALEFALVLFPFLTLMLATLELSFDFFTQEVLSNALHQAVRQLQTGNAQNVKDGYGFINSYLCPDTDSLLICSTSTMFINVQKISPSSTQDYYDFTTGSLPLTGGALNLSAYSASSFCNGAPSELLLISAVYVGPTFVAGLLPNFFTVNYNGSQVHASFATVGVVSENFPVVATGGTVTPAKSC